MLTRVLPAIIDRVYTTLLRLSLNHVGRGSVIGFPVKLTNPGKIWIGDNVRITAGTWLNAPPDDPDVVTLRLGDGSYIGGNCHINAWGKVEIGKHVLISNGVHISDATHTFDRLDTPIALQPARFGGAIKIDDGAWIGHGAVILPAVTIGKNAVVGALALVRQNIPELAIAGGIPARIIRQRKLNE